MVLTHFVSHTAEAAAQEVKDSTGRRALAVQGNVAVWEDVPRRFEEGIEEFGRIDILVNNAGITRDKLILRMTEEDWDAVVDSNLKGAFFCTKAVARIMLKQEAGKIVNIASVMGIVGNPGQANYSASKGGII